MSKMTVIFTEAQDAMLSEMAKEDGLTKAQTLRRALALLRYAQEQKRQGHQLAVVDSAGEHILVEIV